ncbi:MAG: hypothetical protein HZA50_00190, partial [Planctomycetes bacterium]|nr:hypothetical protein [Planctomycetota bacterium]
TSGGFLSHNVAQYDSPGQRPGETHSSNDVPIFRPRHRQTCLNTGISQPTVFGKIFALFVKNTACMSRSPLRDTIFRVQQVARPTSGGFLSHNVAQYDSPGQRPGETHSSNDVPIFRSRHRQTCQNTRQPRPMISDAAFIYCEGKISPGNISAIQSPTRGSNYTPPDTPPSASSAFAKAPTDFAPDGATIKRPAGLTAICTTMMLTAFAFAFVAAGCQTDIPASQPTADQIQQIKKDILKFAEEGIAQDNKKAAEYDNKIFFQEYKFDRVMFFIPDDSKNLPDSVPDTKDSVYKPEPRDIPLDDFTVPELLPFDLTERLKCIPKNAIRKEWTDRYILAQQISYQWSPLWSHNIHFENNSSMLNQATIELTIFIKMRCAVIGKTNIPPPPKGMKPWRAHFFDPTCYGRGGPRKLGVGWNNLPTPWMKNDQNIDPMRTEKARELLSTMPYLNYRIDISVKLKFDTEKKVWTSIPDQFFPLSQAMIYSFDDIPDEYKYSIFNPTYFPKSIVPAGDGQEMRFGGEF